MNKSKKRISSGISVDLKVKKDFKIYCAQKRKYMIDFVNELLIKEMIENKYVLTFDPNEYGL